MMKKSICILTLLAIVLSFVACEEKAPPSIIGIWEYSNHSELKEYLTEQLDDSYFFKVYYQFDEDGSGSTWTENYPDNKFEFTYTFDGETLSISLGDGNTQNLECEFHGTYFYVSDGKEDMKFNKIK